VGIPTKEYLRIDVRIKTAFCQEKNGLRNGKNDHDFMIFLCTPDQQYVHDPCVS
jgi:hypothetical protein